MTPTGFVTFTDNAAPFATANLASGIATTSFTITAGNHNVVAVYNGDSRFPPSSITIGLSPDNPTSNANLAATSASTGTAQSVTLTVQVNGSSPGYPAPTGRVAFIDGAAFHAFAIAPLVNGVATLDLTSLAPGPHSIAATYAGDSVWSGASAGLRSRSRFTSGDSRVTSRSFACSQPSSSRRGKPFPGRMACPTTTHLEGGADY